MAFRKFTYELSTIHYIQYLHVSYTYREYLAPIKKNLEIFKY